jgi:hypothetical protein
MSETSSEESSWFDEAVEAVASTADAAVETVQQTYDTAVQTVEQTYESTAETAQQVYDYGAETAQQVYDYGAETAQQVYDYGAETAQQVYDYGAETAQQVYDYGAETAQQIYDYGAEIVEKVYDYGTGYPPEYGDGGGEAEQEQELVIDIGEFPSIQSLSQAGSIEAWLASSGVSGSFTDDPCLLEWGEAAVQYALCVAAVAAIFTPPLTVLGVIGLAYEGYSLVRGIQAIGDCYEQNGRADDAASVRQHAGALQAEFSRLEALAS